MILHALLPHQHDNFYLPFVTKCHCPWLPGKPGWLFYNHQGSVNLEKGLEKVREISPLSLAADCTKPKVFLVAKS